MTRKIYKSAMGKTVDLGALLLQNEQVRAVGNMGVNAAGDLVDSSNRVIDQRNRQVQKQYKRQTNVSDTATMSTSNVSAKKVEAQKTKMVEDELMNGEAQAQEMLSALDPAPSEEMSEPAAGGLAAAIARSREVKQELEKSLRQRQQEQGIRKI
jgi:hypothetical protein